MSANKNIIMDDFFFFVNLCQMCVSLLSDKVTLTVQRKCHFEIIRFMEQERMTLLQKELARIRVVGALIAGWKYEHLRRTDF